jgi:hypothetical protein
MVENTYISTIGYKNGTGKIACHSWAHVDDGNSQWPSQFLKVSHQKVLYQQCDKQLDYSAAQNQMTVTCQVKPKLFKEVDSWTIWKNCSTLRNSLKLIHLL